MKTAKKQTSPFPTRSREALATFLQFEPKRLEPKGYGPRKAPVWKVVLARLLLQKRLVHHKIRQQLFFFPTTSSLFGDESRKVF